MFVGWNFFPLLGIYGHYRNSSFIAIWKSVSVTYVDGLMCEVGDLVDKWSDGDGLVLRPQIGSVAPGDAVSDRHVDRVRRRQLELNVLHVVAVQNHCSEKVLFLCRQILMQLWYWSYHTELTENILLKHTINLR